MREKFYEREETPCLFLKLIQFRLCAGHYPTTCFLLTPLNIILLGRISYIPPLNCTCGAAQHWSVSTARSCICQLHMLPSEPDGEHAYGWSCNSKMGSDPLLLNLPWLAEAIYSQPHCCDRPIKSIGDIASAISH